MLPDVLLPAGNLSILEGKPAHHPLITFQWEELGPGTSQRIFKFADGLHLEDPIHDIAARCIADHSPAPSAADLRPNVASGGLALEVIGAAEIPTAQATVHQDAGLGVLPEGDEDADVI